MSAWGKVLTLFSLIICVLNCVWLLLNQYWLGLLKLELRFYQEASLAVLKQALQEFQKAGSSLVSGELINFPMFDFVSCFQLEIAYVEIILMCYEVQYYMLALCSRLS